MATSEGIPSSIDIEFLELNDNPYSNLFSVFGYIPLFCHISWVSQILRLPALLPVYSTEFGDKAKIIQPTSGLQYKSIQLFLG